MKHVQLTPSKLICTNICLIYAKCTSSPLRMLHNREKESVNSQLPLPRKLFPEGAGAVPIVGSPYSGFLDAIDAQETS